MMSADEGQRIFTEVRHWCTRARRDPGAVGMIVWWATASPDRELYERLLAPYARWALVGATGINGTPLREMLRWGVEAVDPLEARLARFQHHLQKTNTALEGAGLWGHLLGQACEQLGVSTESLVTHIFEPLHRRDVRCWLAGLAWVWARSERGAWRQARLLQSRGERSAFLALEADEAAPHHRSSPFVLTDGFARAEDWPPAAAIARVGAMTRRDPQVALAPVAYAHGSGYWAGPRDPERIGDVRRVAFGC